MYVKRPNKPILPLSGRWDGFLRIGLFEKSVCPHPHFVFLALHNFRVHPFALSWYSR